MLCWKDKNIFVIGCGKLVEIKFFINFLLFEEIMLKFFLVVFFNVFVSFLYVMSGLDNLRIFGKLVFVIVFVVIFVYLCFNV